MKIVKIVKRKNGSDVQPGIQGQRVSDYILKIFSEMQDLLESSLPLLSKITEDNFQKNQLLHRFKEMISYLEGNKLNLEQKIYVQNHKLEEIYEELKKAHQELEESYEKLQKASEREKLAELGEAMARLVHEIKNPLAVIDGFVQLLPQKYDKPEFKEKFIQNVSREIKRLSVITKRILSFSKPIEPKKENVPLELLVTEVIAGFESMFQKKKIIFSNMVSNSFQILADADLIKQVFINLVENAVQAMDEKGGKLKIGALKSEKVIRVGVEDSGKGIAPENIPKVFNPFFTTNSQGAGLGLSICKNIIEKHGGRIWVESVLHKGAKFFIELPCK